MNPIYGRSRRPPSFWANCRIITKPGTMPGKKPRLRDRLESLAVVLLAAFAALPAPPLQAQAQTAGVCGRTAAVRTAILGRISGVTDCANVTDTHLAAITGTLDLSSDGITALAAGDFDGLTAVTRLYLKSNPITTLPDDIFDDLTALEELYLRNALTTLPDEVFDELTALRKLWLYGNGLTSLPDGIFDELTALEKLWLNDNDLTTLPDDIFDDLTSLRQLVLADNDLISLPDDIFDELTALEELYLRNALTTLPAGVFDELTSLTNLGLSNNGLTTLPDDIFEPLTALWILALGANPGAPFAPTAVALPDDGTVSPAGGTVMLDGSGSGGAWGTNVTYSWALTDSPSGVTVTFDDAASATPVVTIPPLTADAELTFTLTVTGRGYGIPGIALGVDSARVTAAIANASPSFTSPAIFNAAENQTSAGTVRASDSDAGDSVTGYALQGGADASKFSIDASTGVLTFASAPNFEAPADADRDNDYVVAVRAMSGAGEREKTADQTITVTVTDVDGEAPGVPGAPTVSSASATSVNVSWTAPSNAGPVITDYDYRYRAASPQGSWTEVTTTTITALAATIGGLAEDTEYEVQVRAANEEGVSGWSASGSGSTDANASPSFTSPAAFNAPENQTSAGTVQASDSDAGDSVTGYAVHGGADRSKFSIDASTGVLTFASAPNFEAPADADRGNDYVVVVRAMSGAGAREKTADQTITVTVTDVGGEAPGVPVAPTVSSASVTSLNVSWTAPTNAGPAITDYDYQYRVTSPQGSWTEVTNTTTTALGATIEGLAEDTEYDVQVRATNDEGTSGWSASGSGSTDADAVGTPDRVTGVSLIEQAERLMVFWNEVVGASGYKVQWKSGGQGYNTGDRQATVPSGSTTSHTITSLTNGTEYTVRVIATRTGSADGPPSAEVTGTPMAAIAAGVTVTPTALTVPEGSSTTYEVVLATQPSDDVTITVSLASGSDADITVNTTSLTFTPDGWSVAQAVMVSASEDADAWNGSATIEHAVSGGDYDSLTASPVTATESDNDEAGVTVTPTALTVTEGSSTTYEVVLATQPSDDVTITVSLASGSDADITVNTTSLTFTPDGWSVAQTVTVSASEDADAWNGSATIEHAVSGGDYGSLTASPVTATESDNDEAGVTVTPTALTVPEGGSTIYEAALAAQPSDDVTITVSLASGSDADITVNTASLTFRPDDWSVAQTVTVSAAEDADAWNGSATIEHAVSGGDYGSLTASPVTATESDNDEAGVTVTPTALTVTEGGSTTYEAALAAQPSDDVTVTVSLASGSDADITVNTASLTFTPDDWSVAQTVTVSAAEDADAWNGSATIEHAVSGGDYGSLTASSVTATESDNDEAGVTVTPTELTVREGASATYAMFLTSAPTEPITIDMVVSGDPDVTITPLSLAFTSDNWDTAQQVTVSAAEDADAWNGSATIEHAVSGGDYGSLTASSVTATESDNDEAGVTVTPTALTVPEGSSTTYEVVLATQPSDDVTITVSLASGSDADITVNTASLTFRPDDWSVAQAVTVSAAQDTDREDDAAMLDHKASGADYGEVAITAVAVTVTDVIGGVDVSGWLARYSRVGAGHLLSSLQNRMERLGRVSSDAEVSVAGQRIVFGDSPAQPGMELSGASAIWSASQSYTTSSLRGGRSVGLMKPFGMTSGLNAAARRYTNMTLRDALSRSAFRYAREMSSGNSFGIWGQGSFSRFSGSESGADMDGDVMSGTVGVDNSFSGWLHGIAVSRSESEGAYRVAGKDSLSLSASLTGIYPYMRYNLTDRLRVWGTGGYGRGSLRLQGDSLASSSSDLSMALGSIGVSGDIVSASSQGFGLSWQTDAMLVRSSLASSRSLSSVEAIVHRLRLSLESSYTLRMGDRASLAPKLELGVRRDGGDAEQGMGLDVAAGLGFVNSAWGLRAQVDMHGMLVHEDSDFEQWGVSGMILFDRSPSLDIGASLRLFPSWGSASSSTGGMRTLWSRETVSGLAGFRRTDSDDRSLRLAGRFDYGFAAFGKNGVTTPYASFSLSGNEARGAVADTGVELGGGLGYSNQSLGLRMQAGVRGLMSDEAMAFDRWGASGVVAFDPDPSSPLGASFNVSPSWGIAPVSGFGGSQNMGGMRQPVTGLSMANLYGRPTRIEGEMGYGFSASDGDGVATPYAGVVFSDRGRSGLLLGFNLQASKRFLLNLESSTPDNGKITLNSVPEFTVRGLMKW